MFEFGHGLNVVRDERSLVLLAQEQVPQSRDDGSADGDVAPREDSVACKLSEMGPIDFKTKCNIKCYILKQSLLSYQRTYEYNSCMLHSIWADSFRNSQ